MPNEADTQTPTVTADSVAEGQSSTSQEQTPSNDGQVQPNADGGQEGQQNSQAAQNTQKVDTSIPKPTVQTDRPKPSQFYADRKRVRKLEAEVMQLKNELLSERNARNTSVPKQEEPKVNKSFWDDPESYLVSQIKELEAKIEAIKTKEIPAALSTKDAEKEAQSILDEAMEVCFPKTNSDKSWREVAKKNPEKQEFIRETLEANQWLNDLSRMHPVEAMKIIESKYKDAHPEAAAPASAHAPLKAGGPSVPSKAHLQSTQSATHNSAQGGNKMTVEQAQEQLRNLANMLSHDSSLVNNPEFNAKYDALNAELDKALKEKGS